MNRDVLLVYLKDLRDLEVAKYQIRATLNQKYDLYRSDEKKIQIEVANISAGDFQNVPEVEWGICILAMFMAAVAALGISPSDGSIILTYFFKFAFIIFCVTALIKFPVMVKDLMYRHHAVKHNKLEQHRMETEVPSLVREQQEILASKKAALQEISHSLNLEENKINQLLKKDYDLNIIPGQYRNLASIYYIYDYMSTSQATLEETLMHEHMENGIQRILERLDTIIAQIEEIILIARRTEANTREAAENTRRMLDAQQQMLASMERTEQNTAEAARVAQVAATYSEINAFFSTAEYLDRQRGR